MAKNQITQAEMIRKVSERTQIAQKYVKEVLQGIVALAWDELLAGRQVKITNLGTFRTATRAARTYKAPLAKRTIKKPDTTTVRFKVTADLKRSLNI